MEFVNLPSEILRYVLSFLDHQSRLTMLEVCHQWNALASNDQFMDRIWLRLPIEDAQLTHQLPILRESLRCYRHVVVDCLGSITQWVNQLAEIFLIFKNIETLVVYKTENVQSTDLLDLLENVHKLQRLYLLSNKAENFWSNSDLPNLNFLGVENTKTRKILMRRLINVSSHDLSIISRLKKRLELFPRMLPNLRQLCIYVEHSLSVHLIDAFKDQLENVSMYSVCSDQFTLFYDMRFPKLTYLYLKTDSSDALEKMKESDIPKCINFFKDPDHARNLRELTISPTCDSVLKTICSNCTSLRVLKVSADNIDILENIAGLQRLHKLSIADSYKLIVKSYVNHRWYNGFVNRQLAYNEIHCQPIQSLKKVEFWGTFSSTMTKMLACLDSLAPNLEELSLTDIGQAEEALQTLSEMSSNIRYLKLTYESHSGKSPDFNFEYLQNKFSLTTYILENVIIEEDGIEKWIQMAPNLSKIALQRCRSLTDAHLMSLVSCCAKLKHLELTDCPRLTTQGLKEFRENVPHVTITGQQHVRDSVLNDCRCS